MSQAKNITKPIIFIASIIPFSIIFVVLLPECLKKSAQVLRKSSVSHLNLYVRYFIGIILNISLCQPTTVGGVLSIHLINTFFRAANVSILNNLL